MLQRLKTNDILRVTVTSAAFCREREREKDTSVTQAGKPNRKAFCTAFIIQCVAKNCCVLGLLELLHFVKIDGYNEILVLPVGLRAATGSLSCQTGDVMNCWQEIHSERHTHTCVDARLNQTLQIISDNKSVTLSDPCTDLWPSCHVWEIKTDMSFHVNLPLDAPVFCSRYSSVSRTCQRNFCALTGLLCDFPQHFQYPSIFSCSANCIFLSYI